MQLSIFNMETEYQNDMKSGLGIDIDTPIPVTRKEIIRNPRGIYSNLFGGDISDSEELLKRYRCQCGDLSGKFREGIICPRCKTPVQFRDDDLEKTGWMTLKDPYVLIPPRMYKFLEKVFKPKVLEEIIGYTHQLDANGNIVYEEVIEAKHPYMNIGIVMFAQKFDEILETLGDKRCITEIQFIKKNRNNIFSRRIPVLNLMLRPVVLINGTTFNYDPINSYYSEMMAHVSFINRNENNDQTNNNLQILFDLQKKWIALDTEIVREKINGKKHTIRQFVLGSRVNFSARHVIIANDSTVKIDAIKIPYTTFCEFYKFHMMNIYRKIYRVTVNELNDRWYTLVMMHDPSIMHIINLLITRTRGGLRMYVNRNPTIALGSIQCFKIMGINEDPKDLTASLPLCILSLMNADFDGDVINFIPLIDGTFADKIEKYFSPERMTISASTGRSNNKVGLIKDQLVGLYSFCNDPFCPEDFKTPDDNFTIITPQMLAARDAYISQKMSGQHAA